MYQFIERPNLPENRVRVVLAGEKYLDALRLDRVGIEGIGVKASPDLDEPVASHADMQVVHLHRSVFLTASVENCKGEKLYMQDLDKLLCKVNKLVEYNNFVTVFRGSTRLVSVYPRCAAYNILLLGNLAVFNPKCIDRKLREKLISLCYYPVFVKQGFTRCSVCIVNERAVITADVGIAGALKENGIDVLVIRPGFIELPGYDTGFIGGASFKLSPEMLAFTGRLDVHPDWKDIKLFLKKYRMDYMFLSDRVAFDMGTAIPILEEKPQRPVLSENSNYTK